VRQIGPTVRALREYLGRALRDATVEGGARTLGVSPRTLQRELRHARTHFTAELLRARVDAACEKLAHTDEKIETIAREVGCISASQLSTLFRRSLGETPGQFRTRRTL
jgi:AraC-like DNA-binding protein